jgi:hypothetical protein
VRVVVFQQAFVEVGGVFLRGDDGGVGRQIVADIGDIDDFVVYRSAGNRPCHVLPPQQYASVVDTGVIDPVRDTGVLAADDVLGVAIGIVKRLGVVEAALHAESPRVLCTPVYLAPVS